MGALLSDGDASLLEPRAVRAAGHLPRAYSRPGGGSLCDRRCPRRQRDLLRALGERTRGHPFGVRRSVPGDQVGWRRIPSLAGWRHDFPLVPDARSLTLIFCSRFSAACVLAGLRHPGSESQPTGLLQAILPQFVDSRYPLPAQVAILAGSSIAIEFTVLSAYSALAFRAGRRAAPRFRLIFERVGGGLLVAAGAGLASLRRE
jgi:hypothetical protein